MSRESIRARLEAATPGDWSADEDGTVLAQTHGGKYDGWFQSLVATPFAHVDSDFIAHARQDLPALLAVADAAADFERMATEHRSLNHAAPEFVILRDALNRLEALP